MEHTRGVSSTEITLLNFNDIYAIEPINGNGGLAEIATLINRERANSKHHITSVNGDFLVASSIANMCYGSHMVDLFNIMGVEMVVIGNHEFDFGPKKLHERIDQSKFMWFSTNLRERLTSSSPESSPPLQHDSSSLQNSSSSSHSPLEASKSTEEGKGEWEVFAGGVQRYIKEVDGFKIGFFGVTTHECKMLSHPGDDVLFLSGIESSKESVELLKKDGADVIIALTHQLYSEDLELAAKVPQIDLILGGHDHHAVACFESNTLIQKCGQNANYLGVVRLLLERDVDGRVHVYHSWKMEINRHIPRDPIVGERVDHYLSQLNATKDIVLGTVELLLDSRTQKVRASEVSMGNFVADSLRDFFSADVCVVQSGSIRGDTKYMPGTTFTQFDMLRECPFPNMASLVKIKGSLLREALEQGVRKLPERAGCFPQISGFSMIVDVSKPVGHRITKIAIGGVEIGDDTVYTCALTEFIRNGGDGYTSFQKAEVTKQRVLLLSTVVGNYIKKTGKIAALIENRTTIIK